MLKKAAADVPVRPAQRVADVGQRKAVGEQARRIDFDVHFFQVPAEGHHVRDAGNLQEIRETVHSSSDLVSVYVWRSLTMTNW